MSRQDDVPASLAYLRRECVRHAREVDHSGFRDEQRSMAVRVRFALADFVAVEHPNALQPVRERAVLEPSSRGSSVIERDDELAADVVRDLVLVGKPNQLSAALAAEPCLERPWRVVKARVDDAGVPPALVGRKLGFLVEHDNPEARLLEKEGVSGREADEPGPDDRDVVPLLRSSSADRASGSIVPC